MLPLEVQTTTMAVGCTMGEAIAILKVSINHARTRRVSDRELRSACMVVHYAASDDTRELSSYRYFSFSENTAASSGVFGTRKIAILNNDH